MNLNRRLILLLSPLLIVTADAHAIDLVGTAALKGCYGKQESSDLATVQSRNLAAFSIDGNFALSAFQTLLVGVNGEYAIWKQLTDPADVSDTNTQGTLTAVTPMVGLAFQSFRLIAKLPVPIVGKYTLANTNAAGQSVFYKDAIPLAIQLHWNASPHTFWGFEYQSISFKKLAQSDGTETTLATDARLKLTSYSLMFGFNF